MTSKIAIMSDQSWIWLDKMPYQTRTSFFSSFSFFFFAHCALISVSPSIKCRGGPPCLDIELQRKWAGSMALIELYSHEYT